MSHAAGSILLTLVLLFAFLYGVILWRLEGWRDDTQIDLEHLQREFGLMLGRERSRDEYLGIEVTDPVPDGPDEWEPEGLDAPRAMEPASLEPETQPIEVAPPTVPDGMPLAVQSALLAVPWEERRAQIEAEWQQKAAEIGGAA